MKITTKFIIFFIVNVSLILCISLSLQGQIYDNQSFSNIHFDRKEWKEIKKDINYSASELKQKESSNNKDRLSNDSRRNDNDFFLMRGAMFQNSNIIKFLFFFLSILALIIVIVKMVKSQYRNHKIPLISRIKELEQAIDKIEESDLDYLLSEAKRKNNLKLSVRIYYLIVLKLLSDRSLIKWKKDKTNRMYEEETKNTAFHKDFQLLTQNFERSWFSGANLTIEQFQIIESRFQGLIRRLKL